MAEKYEELIRTVTFLGLVLKKDVISLEEARLSKKICLSAKERLIDSLLKDDKMIINLLEQYSSEFDVLVNKMEKKRK